MEAIIIFGILVTFLLIAWRFAYDSREGVESDVRHSSARGPEWGSLQDVGVAEPQSSSMTSRKEATRVAVGAKAD
jgi:hypothetical protein